MGLAIYDENRVKIKDFANRILTSHNGTLGEAVDTLLYIRNDDVEKYYVDITAQVQDQISDDDTLGPQGTGWGVKLSAGSRRPTFREWEAIVWSGVIDLDDIGNTTQANTTTYYPFWLRVVVPGDTVAQTKTEMKLIVSAAERLVGT